MLCKNIYKNTLWANDIQGLHSMQEINNIEYILWNLNGKLDFLQKQLFGRGKFNFKVKFLWWVVSQVR